MAEFARKFQAGEKVLVESEGFEGEILIAYADGTYLVEMNVVNEDGEDWCMMCMASELAHVAAGELAALRRANALAEAALERIEALGDEWGSSTVDLLAAIARNALAAMHAATSDADTPSDAGAEGAAE